MSLTKAFFAKVNELLQQVEVTQGNKIKKAADIVAKTIAENGIIYTFGTGHSHCVAEEVIYRAGGLAPFDAILEPSLTGNTDVVKSEQLERIEGISQVIFEHRKVTANDCMIIISNSGRNAAPIDMALVCKEKGVPVIAITSLQYTQNVTPRHSSGKRLSEVADIVIDNCGCYGDAAIHLENLITPMGSTSNIMGASIMHAITLEAAQNLLSKDIQPPVFLSGNLDHCKEVNQQLLDRYWGNIKTW